MSMINLPSDENILASIVPGSLVKVDLQFNQNKVTDSQHSTMKIK